MNRGVPTLKEFTELVKYEYLDPEWVVDEKDALNYLKSDEAQNHIKAEYERGLKKHENGEIDVEGFREDFASGVANCLFLMHE